METGCRVCKPQFFDIQGPPLGEGHVAIRFGHPGCMFASVFLAGVQIFDCYEVLAGPGGWALRYVAPEPRSTIRVAALCDCGSGEILRSRHWSNLYSVQYAGIAQGVVPPAVTG
jgi:hypothetical protein